LDKSIGQAKNKLLLLKEKVLVELKFSTGNSPQKFVPVEQVMNATI
jgi:hypothetical protein